MTIYAAVRGQILYVATWSPGNNSVGVNDHFIFVTDQLLASASAPAPWAKAGTVAVPANKPFIGGESATTFCGWFNAPAGSQVVKSASNNAQMEGTIDLVAAFGSMPPTIYLAAAAYATADGGVLVSQGPPGNNDGNLDPPEFLALAVPAIRDENADGIFDRLDPALDLIIIDISRADGLTTITWNFVPGKTYQLRSSNQISGPWDPVNDPITAGPGQITLSTTDSSGGLSRFYRTELVNR